MPPRLNLIPDAILWHEGMLLRPEHFEVMTQRQEMLLERGMALPPYGWGVELLTLDLDRLSAGVFSPLELEVQLPSGLSVWVDKNTKERSSTELGKLDTSYQQQPFFVYLTLAAVSGPPGADNRAYQPSGDAAETLRADQSTLPEPGRELERMPIPHLRRRFELKALRQAPSSDVESIPLARMLYRSGVFVVDEQYFPPVLRVTADSGLGRFCRQTTDKVREHARVLAQRWRQEPDQSLASAYSLRSLAAVLPMCEAVLASGVAHPFTVYLSFCALAGQVAGTSGDPVPPRFQPYDHNDLQASFTEVCQYVTDVLAEGDASDFLKVEMTFKAGVFSAELKKEWAGRKLLLALRPTAGHQEGVAEWCRNARIGAARLQEGMRERRVQGAEARRAGTDEGLPLGPGVLLYELTENTRGEMKYLLPGEVLEVATGSASRAANVPVEAVLYVRDKGQASTRDDQTHD